MVPYLFHFLQVSRVSSETLADIDVDKLTSQSNALCGQLRPLRPTQRTANNETRDGLRPRKDLAKASWSVGEVAEGTWPTEFVLCQERPSDTEGSINVDLLCLAGMLVFVEETLSEMIIVDTAISVEYQFTRGFFFLQKVV